MTNYQAILRFFLARHGGQTSPMVGQIAGFLKDVARHHVKADEDAIAKMKRIVANLTPPRRGMTAKNRERLRPFDAVLLGMGEDGHFASLFPGSPVLGRGLDIMGDAFVLDVPAGDPAPPQPRYSLSLRALSGAAACLLLITGEAKKRTLEQARENHLPVVSLIDALQPRILWAP